MKDEFVGYLKAIGLTDVLINRIGTVYEFYQGVCPEELVDIFVTDLVKQDGSREYENLWLFSQGYAMEAKSFVTKDNFDMTPQRKIVHWTIEKQDYDFRNATEKSRLYLVADAAENLHYLFKASKENCDYLREIFRKYILPNCQ